jgi:hypothetical protein
MPQLSLVSQFGNPTLTSLRVTGNTIMGNNLNVIGSVTVSGSLTAQSLIVNSTNVITGSTIFGSSITDTHRFTGSVLVTGSMNVVGSATATSFAGSGASLTSIPNSALNNSTISGIALGSNLATLTIGNGLSGTSYNGSTGITIANSDRGSSQNIFKNFAVSGQSTVVAEINDDTLTLVGSGATTITTNASTDTITISSVNTTYSVGDGGLTQVNFTTTRRDKLDGIATGATNVTNNNQLTNGAGYITSAGTSADSNLLNGISAVNLFNNMGGAHSTRTSFDATTPSYGFGFRYVQGSTNGPGTGGSQYYSWYIGLGSEYPATGGGSYGAMFAVDRNITGPYLSVRYNENNSFGSWRRIYAGYADSAGGVAWTNVSGRPTALSQFSNDLGNYGNWYSNNGGTISGNVTINGSSNDVLTLNQAQAYINIYSTGASNDGGLKIYPTTGFNAIVGNFRGGELVLYASSTDAVYINSNSIRVNKYRFKDNGTLSGNGTPEIVDKANVGMSMQSLNYHWYNSNAGTLLMELNSSGDTYNLNGTYGTISSDRRLKENIAPATPKLDDIMKLNVVNFNLIGNENKHIGFIAQEIQEIFPSFVHQSDTRKYDEDGNVVSGLEDALGVKIGMEFAILVKAIQEQQSQITQQNELITSLQSRLTAAGL